MRADADRKLTDARRRLQEAYRHLSSVIGESLGDYEQKRQKVIATAAAKVTEAMILLDQ